ncbi:MAG TPA: M23 family metallopeptidase [Stellaceae bacterium]|nr:M23 family metallopeptidase [Stellaceae bacterium]
MASSVRVRGDSAYRLIASFLALAIGLLGAASLASADPSSRESERQIVRVKRGDTLTTLLVHWGATPTEAQDVAGALRPIWNPRELRIGQEVTLQFGEVGLETIEIDANLDHAVRAQRNAEGHFSPTSMPRNLARVPHLSVGTIKTSLYDAAVIAGVPQPVLQEMTRAFSYDVDFQREVQPGDTFEVLFENIVDKRGEVIANGSVIYASMTLSGHTLRVYRFLPEDGFADFFNPAGQSVKKALLRTPIDGARLTSGFGQRMHPILGYSRMHRGVDFGAVQGTPIMAAGDGIVEKAGPDRGYGNFVLLRHNGNYETAYAHLSRFGSGIKAGARVHQGQIIGYVGMTGLATGPHLHYEVRIGGNQVNPLSVKMAPGRNLAGNELRAFHAVSDEIDRQLISARQDLNLVASTGAGAAPHQ